MGKTNRLSDADHLRVSDAVTAAERGTDGEIVTIVTDRSDDYVDIAFCWSIGIALLVLALLAAFPNMLSALLAGFRGGWEHETSIRELLSTTFLFVALSFGLGWLVMRAVSLRLALTPSGVKARRVRNRAIRYFKVGAEARTMKKTGVLLYLSMREHVAEIVADEAVHRAVAPDIWGDAMAALVAHVREGRPGEGMAAAIEQIGAILAEHFPKDHDDPNELPDRLIEL